jgi:hypothetical protein
MVISLSFGSIFSIATVLFLNPVMFISSEQLKPAREGTFSTLHLINVDKIIGENGLETIIRKYDPNAFSLNLLVDT